jgi:hypothetical protein
MIKKSLLSAVGAIGLMMAAHSASALTMAPEACIVGSVSGATACSGIWEGNDSNQDLSGLFGIATWTEVVKHNSGAAGSTANNGVELTIDYPVGSAATWAVDTYNNNDPVIFVLKAANTFSAFLMNTAILSGTFDTQSALSGGINTPAQNRDRGPGLSHWTIYSGGTGGGVIVPPVPLPATLPLLLTAIGFGGFTLRKSRKSA